MKVLVVGSGGREDALVWKLASSPRVKKIYCAPGNGGIAGRAECVPVGAADVAGLKGFAEEKKIDLTVVGPEAPLVAGIVDEFTRAGLKIFGPAKELARLEGSKVFAKETMAKLKIPTAGFEVFDSAPAAYRFIDGRRTALVIKADGLAAGKGVVVAADAAEARSAVRMMMEEKRFGPAGERIVIEECLRGEEASILVVTDGKTVVPLASSQDHKRIGDHDTGPNTGGMGAYSPAPVIDDRTERRVLEEIIRPLVGALAAAGGFYRGVLYAGIMVTDEGPKVLEFNVRFGDPETQAIIPRLKSDLFEVMERTAGGNLAGTALSWEEGSCVCVVLASGGYPGKYRTGFPVTGLENAGRMPGVTVFHAGTEKRGERILTAGGRVLGVTAVGGDVGGAISRAYEAIDQIHFKGMCFRRDIGSRALNRPAAENRR